MCMGKSTAHTKQSQANWMDARMDISSHTRLCTSMHTSKVASHENTNKSAAGSATDAGGAGTSGESDALFSKLRSFSIGSGPNSPQRVVSNLRGYLTHRLSNITPSDTGECS
ncbi:unnamed protein product [Ceratitis capitata]|uniref:(Mediterranean fruit fly) hypothetical protein n=1 Tax=Ceratitis capitata TaxID=7213 RepID=A0A811UA68_CERCA|nr:unnamed protein product [Ceratitis capitata]